MRNFSPFPCINHLISSHKKKRKNIFSTQFINFHVPSELGILIMNSSSQVNHYLCICQLWYYWKIVEILQIYDFIHHFSRSVLRQAFEKWSNSSRGALIFKDLSPLDRTTGSAEANFDVLFAKYAHGDKESFDGFGGIVAHSGYPVEGIIHFDGSEYWSIDGNSGLDLRYVRFVLFFNTIHSALNIISHGNSKIISSIFIIQISNIE